MANESATAAAQAFTIRKREESIQRRISMWSRAGSIRRLEKLIPVPPRYRSDGQGGDGLRTRPTRRCSMRSARWLTSTRRWRKTWSKQYEDDAKETVAAMRQTASEIAAGNRKSTRSITRTSAHRIRSTRRTSGSDRPSTIGKISRAPTRGFVRPAARGFTSDPKAASKLRVSATAICEGKRSPCRTS